jgi:hypothetical protein
MFGRGGERIERKWKEKVSLPEEERGEGSGPNNLEKEAMGIMEGLGGVVKDPRQVQLGGSNRRVVKMLVGVEMGMVMEALRVQEGKYEEEGLMQEAADANIWLEDSMQRSQLKLDELDLPRLVHRLWKGITMQITSK